MIRIRARRHADGLEISAVGHAGYAERGRDIVCAGVSALLFGFLHYLTDRVPSAAVHRGDVYSFSMARDSSGGCSEHSNGRKFPSIEYRTEEGSLWVRTHGMQDADAAAWAVTRAGLLLIESEYPTHVRLSDMAESQSTRKEV